jgi:hypothetical protein
MVELLHKEKIEILHGLEQLHSAYEAIHGHVPKLGLLLMPFSDISDTAHHDNIPETPSPDFHWTPENWQLYCTKTWFQSPPAECSGPMP